LCSVCDESNAVSNGQVVAKHYTSKNKKVQKPGIVAPKKEKKMTTLTPEHIIIIIIIILVIIYAP